MRARLYESAAGGQRSGEAVHLEGDRFEPGAGNAIAQNRAAEAAPARAAVPFADVLARPATLYR